MSHFTVLVVGDNPTAQLQPFQENNMGDCPRAYMEFKNCDDEVRKAWEEMTKDPEEYEKDKSLSFEAWVERKFGYERDDMGEHFGYWENPNAKWDWYQLGGRWTGFFKLKPAVLLDTPEGKVPIYPLHAVGQPGVMTEPCTEKGYADQAFKKDIDFEAMRQEAYEGAVKTWDAADSLLQPGDRHHFKTWPTFRDCYYPENIKRARKEYHNQPAVKNIAKGGAFFFVSDKILSLTRERYGQEARAKAISTFAVLLRGKWYQRGQMGWWANVTNENDNWDEEFGRLMDEIPDNVMLSVFDCHI